MLNASFCLRRLAMDKRIEWPWSLEEEAEWKAELEQRQQDEELMGETDEDELSSSSVLGIPEEEPAEGSISEKYSVTT
jgi:hypothetical protein